MTEDKPKPKGCQFCGKCCYYKWKGKVKKCRHLINNMASNVCLCRIFSSRFNKPIEIDTKTKKVVNCMWRKDSVYDYEGCPFNTGKKIWKVKEGT